jgi:hypothetical protein
LGRLERRTFGSTTSHHITSHHDDVDDDDDGETAIVDDDARVATREIATIVATIEAVSTTARGGKE